MESFSGYAALICFSSIVPRVLLTLAECAKPRMDANTKAFAGICRLKSVTL